MARNRVFKKNQFVGGIDYKLEISQKLRDLKTYLVASNLEKHSQDVKQNETNGSDHMIHIVFQKS